MPEKKPLFSNMAAVYFGVKNKMSVSFKRGLAGKSGLAVRQFPCLTASFGCEGDLHAPIAFVDGSYRLRDRKNTFVTFGVENIESKINWYNKEGFLPCFVSEYSKAGVDYSVESFADKVTVDGNDFEFVYSRLTVLNKTSALIPFPKVSRLLTPLCNRPRTVAPDETAVCDYAVSADRFGGKYPHPSKQRVAAAGGFNEHYSAMRSYWLARLEPLTEITALPDERLINAYKAGYIYMMIIKDGFELHVGENGYDRVFDHDVLGMLASLILMGDFKYFDEYTKTILKNMQYPDAKWKYSWVFALYLLKTGDEKYIREQFDVIRRNAHTIESDREGSGIMKKSNAIDSHGSWTIDNQSALTGLCCYEYICTRLGFADEARWALNQYNSLLDAANAALDAVISKYSLSYIPISLTEPNESGQRSDPRDANWASMFLFGRWSWDAYLFGARQQGAMLDLIDATYDHGFDRRKDISQTPYNFGGYPHGYYSSAYNAGYGSAALRGEKWRECGIRGYQFMLDCSQSGPFSWWEGIGYPDEKSPWSIPHAAKGAGSCQHMWGQSTATKVLLDSLICEKSDGTVLIGRGVPKDWMQEGAHISVAKFPIAGGKRMGYDLTVKGSSVVITLSGDRPQSISVELPGADEYEIVIK